MRLWVRQQGKCYHCGALMVIRNLGPRPDYIPADLATIDHLDSRWNPERGKHPNKSRRVLACARCNWERGRAEERAQPIEELRRRSRMKRIAGRWTMSINDIQSTVIYPDVTASQKNYAHLGDEELLISNVFLTLQGEGPFCGCRAVFVRLAGCNLGGKTINGPGCSWCDTDFRLSRSMRMSFDAIIDLIIDRAPFMAEIASSNGNGNDLLVITGGEPLLQPNLTRFIERLRREWPGLTIQIETNGTHALDVGDSYLVVSPKVPEVKNRSLGYGKIPSSVWMRADCLKILISADSDSPYHVIPRFAFDFRDSGRPVYLSPINVYIAEPVEGASLFDAAVFNQAACRANHERAARLCVHHGFMLSIQQHLLGNLA